VASWWRSSDLLPLPTPAALSGSRMYQDHEALPPFVQHRTINHGDSIRPHLGVRAACAVALGAARRAGIARTEPTTSLTRLGRGPGLVVFLPPRIAMNAKEGSEKPLDPDPVRSGPRGLRRRRRQPHC
jgi:hypothetical protein